MSTENPYAEVENNLIAAGALFALLRLGTVICDNGSSLTSVEVVVDAEGNVTNQIDITLSFMASPYRITVERVTDGVPFASKLTAS